MRIARTGRRPPPPSVTDEEIATALSWLERYPIGFSRADLKRVFGNDRRGRDVLAALAERGIAAIVVVPSPYQSDKNVYRLAKDDEEVRREEARLLAYETSARARREGLRTAWAGGPKPRPAQRELF